MANKKPSLFTPAGALTGTEGVPLIRAGSQVLAPLQDLVSLVPPGGVAITDGVNSVAGATQITVTGGTVGGASPDATLDISGGGDPLALVHGLSVTAINPTIGSDANDRRGIEFNVTYDAITSNPTFSDQIAQAINLNFNHGLNVYSGGTNAKFTPIALAVNGDFVGSGEKFGFGVTANHYSMGDSFLMGGDCRFSGGPIAGDEGQAFSPSFNLTQATQLCLNTITSPPVISGYNTTITSNVTAALAAQNIPVATTTGAVVGDWVVLNQQLPQGGPNMAVMQIISINPGVSINGICPINMTSGALIRTTLCLTLINTIGFGQDRCLVNVSGASYSTGTVNSISTGAGGPFNGSGTAWTTTMVGGDANNIGAIYLDSDTFTGAPFNGTFPNEDAPLHSYYQIISINSTTSLTVLSMSVANDRAYHGNGVGTTKTYKIQPCARVLYVNPPGTPYSVICEYTTATWTNGDIVELAICPYPDVHGWDYKTAVFTPGGVRRPFLSVNNTGARMFEACFASSTIESTIGQAGSDPYAWGIGLSLFSVKTGILINGAATAAIEIQNDNGNQSGLITWFSGQRIEPIAANDGMDFTLVGTGTGLLRVISSSVSSVDSHRSQLSWTGYLQLCSPGGGYLPYLRFGGSNTLNASIDGTVDLLYEAYGLNVIINDVSDSQTIKAFHIDANAASVGTRTVAASNTTNVTSNSLGCAASVWNGATADAIAARFAAVPGSGVNSAPVSMQLQINDNTQTGNYWFNHPFEVRVDGLLKFGYENEVSSHDYRLTLDAITNLTAARTVTYPDATGASLVRSAGSAPATAAAAGTPGEVRTDGTYLYICTATNTWLRSACATW
jgi:hypothetical protein